MNEYNSPGFQNELYERIYLSLAGLERYNEPEAEAFLFQKAGSRNVLLRKCDRYTPALRHFHDYFEILYVLYGRCDNTIGTEKFSMSAGCLCFIAPYINHTSEVLNNGVTISIFIRKTTFEGIFFNFLTSRNLLSDFFISNLYPDDPIEYSAFDLGPDTDLIECVFLMLGEQSNHDESSARIVDSLVSMFFFLVIRKSKKNTGPVGGDTDKRQYLSYINENFRTATLQDVANHFNISLAHCSRLVKSLAGKNFNELVRDIRLRHARALLVSTGMKIYDISYSLGYKNQETFIRCFTKTFGCSPGRYRSKNAEAELPNPAAL